MNLERSAHDISVVLFDLGRVLVNIDFEAFPRALGLVRNATNRTDEVSIEKMVAAYETGQMETKEFFDGLDNIFRHQYSRTQLVDAWNAIIGEENLSIVPIVEAIQKSYDTALLSNTNPSHIQKAMATSPMIRQIKKRFLSFEMGAMKPEPAVYRYVIRHLSVEPSSILFVDDIAENIRSAEQCGMMGIIFRDTSQLKEDLILRGLLHLS